MRRGPADDECCNAFSSAVQQIDEAVEALEQLDQDMVMQEQEIATTRFAAKADFQKAYAERRRAWGLAKDSKKQRAAARGRPDEEGRAAYKHGACPG